MFRAAAVLAAVALMTFAGCTKVDDTLGSNLVPDNQQMKVGYTTLGARTLAGKLDAAKYVETRLFQSDSLKASNISYGYMGQCFCRLYRHCICKNCRTYITFYASFIEGYLETTLNSAASAPYIKYIFNLVSKNLIKFLII